MLEADDLNEDDLDGALLPPELQFTPENIRQSFERSKADIAAGRLIPVEDVLRELRERQAKRLEARKAAGIAAE